LRPVSTEARQTIDVQDARHILQNDKLLGKRVDEVVKQWDAQKEEFYEKTGLSRGNELAVIKNDESGVLPNEEDAFDEITQLLLE
jgi:snRNA-activating protein complex subunit 1